MEQNDSKGLLGQEASGAPNVACKEKACGRDLSSGRASDEDEMAFEGSPGHG